MIITMTIAQLHGEIKIAIPSIMEGLKDRYNDVRAAAVNGLSGLVACMRYHLFLFDMLNHDCS